ncbi:Transmembrane domain-containing protein [Spironucleus salmonicida]|uniref:Transmembrane domain-containing protein n=1 Tax=Spironucleus salmonicida TaxID=348837 RepID=A0A9P8RYM6_9EUKA|nr:Transmembrane domain-containing protein [Spironucleus salmonicida]
MDFAVRVDSNVSPEPQPQMDIAPPAVPNPNFRVEEHPSIPEQPLASKQKPKRARPGFLADRTQENEQLFGDVFAERWFQFSDNLPLRSQGAQVYVLVATIAALLFAIAAQLAVLTLPAGPTATIRAVFLGAAGAAFLLGLCRLGAVQQLFFAHCKMLLSRLAANVFLVLAAQVHGFDFSTLAAASLAGNALNAVACALGVVNLFVLLAAWLRLYLRVVGV